MAKRRSLGESASGSVSLIVKGPLKSAQRAAARHNVPVLSCRVVGTAPASSKGNDVQCYAPCSAEARINDWFAQRGRVKVGRGFSPGTLLYYSGRCGARELGRYNRRRRGR